MIIHTIPRFIRSIFPPGLLWEIPNRKNYLYLTFDDGPVPQVTPKLLDLLDNYDVKATFFMVGDNVNKYPDLLQLVISRGHAVGNHSYNHIKGWSVSDEVYFENVKKASDLIPGNLFRPPYGRITPNQAKHLTLNYRVVMWSILSEDYNTSITPEKTFSNVKKNLKSGSIIVFHDSIKAEKNMFPALKQSIEYALDQGFTFSIL